MITKAFALFDTKGQMFNVPFFMPQLGMAVRAIVDLGSDLNTTVGRHPGDFALFELGSFDDQSGQMIPCTPINHGLVSTFLPQQPAAPLFNITEAIEASKHLSNGDAREIN